MTRYQQALEALANISLLDAENYKEFTPKDLEHATLIFTSVFTPLMYDNHKRLGEEKCSQLATEFGNNIRQTVKLATGYDLAEIVKMKV